MLDLCCVSDLAKHLHNRMIATLLYNCSRDLPDQPVAPWVTAENKPANASKPMLPDAADQGLKAEVMLLPLRDRRRLKEMAEVRVAWYPLIRGYSVEKFPDAISYFVMLIESSQEVYRPLCRSGA